MNRTILIILIRIAANFDFNCHNKVATGFDHDAMGKLKLMYAIIIHAFEKFPNEYYLYSDISVSSVMGLLKFIKNAEKRWNNFLLENFLRNFSGFF